MTRLHSFPEDSVAWVQGASRGIGLEFVRQLSGDVRIARVYASCRSPDEAHGLQELADSRSSVRPVALDITRPETIEAAAGLPAREGHGVNLVLNVAGILHATDGLFPERRLEDIELDRLEQVFRVNALGPAVFMRHLAPQLRGEGKAVFGAISARVGSIEDNRMGGWYAYRASKAALNQFIRCTAIELGRRRRNAIVVALHPGTTDTGLSEPFQKNVPEDKLFSVERTVGQLLEVIDGLEPDDSGGFRAWDGRPISW